MSEAAAQGGFARLLSDDRLARRAVGGDERAFAAIFRRYHQSLYRFCLAIVGNPEDAQDALQNTMMKVLRALPGEERQIELKPWLYRIAHNESVDFLRRRRETRQLDVELAAPGYGLAEDAETRERLRRLIADLHELPDRQREVLVMRELAGLDFEEIGAALGTSGAVARQTLYEARQSLRQMEEGRDMSCEAVTMALSDGDGRVTRRRDVRAHLRSCAGCRRFRDEIKGRQRDFAALAPLPAVAAVGMLQGLIGGGQSAVGGSLAATLGGGAAKSIGASAAVKGAATVAVVAAIGVTAADRTGVVDLGLPGDNGAQSSGAEQGASPGSAAGSRGGSSSGTAADDKGGTTGEGAARSGANDSAGNSAQPAGTPANSHGHGKHHARPPAKAKAEGPSTAHPHGRGHEKQHPAAATQGQETASGHKASPTGPSDAGGSSPVKPEKPAQPAPNPPPAQPAPGANETQRPSAAAEGAQSRLTTPSKAATQPRDDAVAVEKSP
jgi:RNA polymerase sigma factor (sigma-70 family)